MSGIALRILSAYTYWHNITRHIPKMRRYSLGIKIDSLFCNLIESVSRSQFTVKEERNTNISVAITNNDVLKFLLYALFELKSIEEKHFLEISSRLDEVGRMLYGWKNKK